MPKSLKNIFIVFSFCQLLCLHPGAYAWQTQDTTSHLQGNLDDYATAADTVVEAYDSAQQVSEESEDENIVEAPAENYNELNFDPITTPPSQTKRSLNETEWSKFRKDPDYQYDDIKEKPVKPPEDYSKSWWARAFGAIFEFLASGAGKILLLLIVAGLVIFLIVRIIMQNGNIIFSKKNKKIGNQTDEHADDYVPENWENEIATAAKAGNYRLALRHSYRYLLTTLTEKELIQFQLAKTNYQYVYELAGTAYHKPFMKLTRDYEYAWYGGFEINESFFNTYYQMAQDIQKQLKH